MKKQINVRLSEPTVEKLKFLVEQYGTQTMVLEVAIALLYSQFENQNAPIDDTTEKKE